MTVAGEVVASAKKSSREHSLMVGCKKRSGRRLPQ
jgi:hypothetical protein